MCIKELTSHPAFHFQWLYWSVNLDHHNNTQVEVDPETGKSLRVDFRFLPWNRCGVLIQQVNSMIITKNVLWGDMSQGIVYLKKHCGNCESNIKSNILYSDNLHSNYLAAAAWLRLRCCTAISEYRLVPFFLFPPVHHLGEELHQILLVLQVAIPSQVLVSFALG